MPIENCYFSNKIDCYGNEFDDELEEGEIVDDDDDNEVIQVVERKTEPEHDEQNPSCIYNECSGEKVIIIIINMIKKEANRIKILYYNNYNFYNNIIL